MIRRVGLAALLVISACSGSDPSTSLPSISLDRVDGAGTLNLVSVEGPALINLWATWCAPCRRELPDIERIHRDVGNDIEVIGINVGDDPAQIRAYLADLDAPAITFTQLADVATDVADYLAASTLPVTLVVVDGDIVERRDVPLNESELQTLIEPYQD